MTMKIRLALAGIAAVLVAAACLYFMIRTPQSESSRVPAVVPRAAEMEHGGAELVSPAEDSQAEAAKRSAVAEQPPGGVAAAGGAFAPVGLRAARSCCSKGRRPAPWSALRSCLPVPSL